MITKSRGQTLVMMSLMALLLTLMVMMTISIGTKIKEKMDVQTMSDSAAYSQAIVTARTFNSTSTLNRVGIAYVVGGVAIQSLVSWSTYVRSNMVTLQTHYKNWNTMFKIIKRTPLLGCCSSFPGGIYNISGCTDGPFCICATIGAIATGIEKGILSGENNLFDVSFRLLDFQAWIELLAFLTSADYVHLAGQLPLYAFETAFMLGQNGVDGLVNQARPGDPYGELKTNGDPDGVNFGEAMPLSGAMYPINPIYWHHVFAANGSRLHPFLTNRTTAGLVVQTKIMTWAPDNIHGQVGEGSGYVTLPPLATQHGSNMIESLFSRHFSADDHSKIGGLLSVYIDDGFACLPLLNRVQFTNVYARIYSNQAFGVHQGNQLFCPVPHSILGLVRGYPWFMDYNWLFVDQGSNIDDQPKDYGIVYRDLARRPANGADQWNPFFRFGFTPSGTSKYDNRGLFMKDGTNISKQVGFSTGVTYYHRGNNSAAEPPNFFNPYWRGGLTRSNIDDVNMGNGDVNSALGSYPAAMDAFNNLKAAGFKGWQ